MNILELYGPCTKTIYNQRISLLTYYLDSSVLACSWDYFLDSPPHTHGTAPSLEDCHLQRQPIIVLMVVDSLVRYPTLCEFFGGYSYECH